MLTRYMYGFLLLLNTAGFSTSVHIATHEDPSYWFNAGINILAVVLVLIAYSSYSAYRREI